MQYKSCPEVSPRKYRRILLVGPYLATESGNCYSTTTGIRGPIAGSLEFVDRIASLPAASYSSIRGKHPRTHLSANELQATSDWPFAVEPRILELILKNANIKNASRRSQSGDHILFAASKIKCCS